MNDQAKTKQELNQELASLRRKIIELKQSEAVKISEDDAREYAESIINTIREPLIVLDQDLRVVTASRSFYDVFMVKPDETVGQLIYDLGNNQWNIPKLRELLETILPQKTTFDNYEVEHNFATIGRRIMLLNARQIKRVLGKERIILLAIEDITERKEIEAGLEKTRKELEVIKKSADEASDFAESVINTVREPLISLDQDLRVVTVSRSFYEFFKVKPEETVGQLIYDLGNNQWNIPKLRELLETILPQKTTFDNYEVEHNFATIGRRVMLLNARQIERGMGKERIILLAIEDITERKHAEEILQSAMEASEKAARAKSVFLASMSHELRTPLNAILGFSNIMRNEAGISEEQRKTLDIINSSGAHLLNLINDVLDMAKIEAGSIDVENAPFDLGEMVRETIDLLRMRAEEKGLELLMDQSPKFPRFIRSDATKLQQVLINLIGNAVKFTPQGKVTLRLDISPADTSQRLLLIIEVEDTGIGISAKDHTRIFDPFVQADNLILQKGTGLGLTISRKHVELMDGKISVESTLGNGSTFRVEIPVERAEESEMSETRISRGRVIGIEPGQPEYRLLIVEDQMENWLLLQRLLENVGFPVRVAGNGAESVEMFQAWQPHLIMMDLRMPVMDGLEATKRIRGLDGGSDVKIVAVTAAVFKEEHDIVIAAGMDDFINKPYRPEEIFACLTRHLGVRFLEEEVSAAPASEPVKFLNPEMVGSLPRELRKELTDVLISLDTARIAETIRRVSELNPVLANALAQHADNFRHTEMLRVLQSCDDISIKIKETP